MSFIKLESDLNHILAHLEDVKEDLRDKSIFLTGGTGFFGIWIQMAFIYLNDKWGLNSKMIILTRDQHSFLTRHPWIKNENVSFLEGNVSNFVFPSGTIDYIIHAATEASVKLNMEEPLIMYDTIVNGTKRVLDLAVEKKVKALLFTSSGAVYGEQPPELTHIPEEYIGAPIPSAKGSMYGEAKRMAETLCAAYHYKHGVAVKVARCFAFVGPFLPLDSHFAAGNFIKSVISKEAIMIKGDGSPFRSYLYSSDLVVWLITILIKGTSNRPYNVGSDFRLSIKQLAETVSSFGENQSKFKIEGISERRVVQYVPCIDRAKEELGLRVWMPLKDSLRSTYNFYLN